MAIKGSFSDRTKLQRIKDVFIRERMQHSRKPDIIHQIAERFYPKGQYLEIFGRKHNLRPNWKTLGNQLGDNSPGAGIKES
jgi:N6-adenosine-specific RNA methylase IME4